MARLRILMLSVVLLLLASGLAQAQSSSAEGHFLQLSLFDPVQIVDREQSVRGIRLSLLYGRNANVSGFDWAWIAAHDTGNGKGVQWALVNMVEGDFLGWQAGLVNLTDGGFTGYQLGGFNRSRGPSESFQFGAINVANDVSGFQLGLFNYAEKMYGLQIGLINIIKSKESLPILPIVNWSF